MYFVVEEVLYDKEKAKLYREPLVANARKLRKIKKILESKNLMM